MSETAAKTCIYPGCERPAVPPHPLGGPQPAFCDLEEHNALTAHQERERLAPTTPRTRRSVMADEAYRAVFLRVHPTGKMVLSLTTESDGKEAEYAKLVAAELGVPALDVKVVPADTDRFGEGHGCNTSPSGGTPAAIASHCSGRSVRRRSCSRAWRWARSRRPSGGSNGAWANGDGSDPEAGQDDRADRPLRARHRRAAPRGRRRSRRTDRLHGDSRPCPYAATQPFTTSQSRLCEVARRCRRPRSVWKSRK